MDNNTSVFWFRRDLRLHDNHGLFKALSTSNKVLAIFIFDTNILDDLIDDDRRVTLIYDRLQELNEQLKPVESKINIYYGKPQDVLLNLFSEYKIDKVFTNTDYEPYANKRDLLIAKKFWLLSAAQYLDETNICDASPNELLKEINDYNPEPSKEMIKLRDLFISLILFENA